MPASDDEQGFGHGHPDTLCGCPGAASVGEGGLGEGGGSSPWVSSTGGVAGRRRRRGRRGPPGRGHGSCGRHGRGRGDGGTASAGGPTVGCTRDAGAPCSSASVLAGPPGRGPREGLGRVLEDGVVEGGLDLVTRVDPLVVVTTIVEATLAAAEHPADALERVGELAGDDPHLVGVAPGDLREHLEVLVGEQLLGRLAAVDRVEDLLDGAGLALGLEDAGLGRALGAQDRALLLALGGEDLRCLVPSALRIAARRSRSALHLLLHRVLDGVGRVDGLELDAVDADPPLAGRLVEHAAQLAVDLVAAGQRLLEVQGADDVAQRGDGELLDALDVVGDLVDGRLGRR